IEFWVFRARSRPLSAASWCDAWRYAFGSQLLRQIRRVFGQTLRNHFSFTGSSGAHGHFAYAYSSIHGNGGRVRKKRYSLRCQENSITDGFSYGDFSPQSWSDSQCTPHSPGCRLRPLGHKDLKRTFHGWDSMWSKDTLW